MKNKIALGVGWFGILTPVLAAGGVLVLWNNGMGVSTTFAIQVGVVCIINFLAGYKILKWVVAEKAK